MPLAITYDRLRKTVRQPNNSNKGNIIREVRGALKPYQKEWDSHYGNDYGTLLEEDKNIEDSDLSDQDYDALLIDLEKSVALLMNKEPVAIVDIIPENLSYNIAATYFGEDKSQWRRKYDDINMTDWTPPQRPGLQNSTKLTQDRLDNNNNNNKINIFPKNSYTTAAASTNANSSLIQYSNKGVEEERNRVNQLPLSYSSYNHEADDDDDDDDDDEDDDEDFSEDQSSLRDIAMSANLKRLLGLEVKEEEMVKTDWQPPATYGLNNSTPIVTHPRRPPQLANDDYKNYSHTSSSDTGESGLFDAAMKNSLQGLLGMGLHDGLDYSVNKSSSFLSQVNVEHQNPVNSGINNQEDDDDEEDDDEEEEEEEEEEGRDLLHTAMSPDLMRLLGLQPSDLAMSTDWKPPSRPGLDNSSPIIKSKQLSISDDETTHRQINNNQSGHITSATTDQSYRNAGDEGNYEEEEDDEDDDDEDEEEDEEDEEEMDVSRFEGVSMSAALRQALGLPPLNQETDWRPPQESGLHNSAPIVRFHT
eukprot:scaffold96_cov167-Ochromonas_danica.AAC.65